MLKNRSFLGNKIITFAALALVIFGSLMIASAEMGNSVGDTAYLTSVIGKQVLYALIGVIFYFLFMHLGIYKFKTKYFIGGYVALGIALLACLAFGQTNGAYAWIWIGSTASIQPSEFAKVFMIVFGAKLLGVNNPETNLKRFKQFAIYSAIYAFIIIIVQSDLGSGVVLVAICYCIMIIPPYKELKKYQRYMTYGILIIIGIIAILLSPPVTEWMKGHSDNYMIGRFLAAANPFLYRYDNGYHVIMALVSFANGGLFGLGYGNSIHKYMNFPNPSNDFILPIIVEELGIVGFGFFILAYATLLVPLVVNSFKVKYISSKMILLGVFIYFVVHFILNVGGVSAIIPLTGVPLLLISSGGSSLLASMMGLGLAQNELFRQSGNLDESNSGEVQKNTD